MSHFIYCYAECRYAECRYAKCHYAECRYAKCRYAEYRGAKTFASQGPGFEPSHNCWGKSYKTVRNKLERLSLAGLSSLVLCL
jgi:hypothetical protein